MYVKRAAALAVTTMLLAASPAEAKDKPWEAIPADLRSQQQPIELVVHVKQEALGVGYDPGVARDTGGGIIGALIDAGIDSSSQKGAAGTLAATRDIFKGADAEALLLNSIRESIRPIPWIKLRDGALRDNSDEAKNALLDAATGPYLLDADCSYSISQRFQAVYAYCDLAIAAKSGQAKPEDRWKPKNLRFYHYVETEVALLNPASGIQGRRAQWMANSAALLRSSLERALAKVGPLVAQRLLMTDQDLLAAKTKPKARFVTAYVGMGLEHKGQVIEGFDNIVGKHHPNAGGLMLLYKQGTDGVVLLQQGNSLYHNFAVEGPELEAGAE